MNQLQLNINKAVMEKYGVLSPETSYLGEVLNKLKKLESLEAESPDRRCAYSIEVSDNLDGDGGKYKHWRWAGTLEQFQKDVREYVSCSEGRFEFFSRNKIVWRDERKIDGQIQILSFHAAKEGENDSRLS
jgi:hypothetical protein